jgi:hypothetical protein
MDSLVTTRESSLLKVLGHPQLRLRSYLASQAPTLSCPTPWYSSTTSDDIDR